MTYTFKLSCRLALLWASACAVVLAAAACTDGDMSSMSPFDQLGNGGTASVSASVLSPKAAVVETNKALRFNSSPDVSWTATGGKMSSDGSFSSSTAGSFLVVGHAKGRTDSARVTVVNPNQPRILSVSPREVQLAVGQTIQFSSSVTLPNGSPTTVDVNWSTNGGSVDKFGNYIAGTIPGTFSVIASAPLAGVADTAVVTVTPVVRHIVQMVLAPAAAVLVADSSQQFVATAKYDDGSVGPVMANFAASGGGTIDSKGRFTAGSTPGTYEVTASAQDGSAGARASVSVTSTQSVASTPGPISTVTDGSILFTDDFSSGDFSRTSGGWHWNRHEKVDVVHGFSKDGNVGTSARFTFDANPDPTVGAWSELRFAIGTPQVQDLWITYYLYIPSGQETTFRGPRFIHRPGPTGTAARSNNKFFRLFYTYDSGYLKYGAETWAGGLPGDGQLMPFAVTRTVQDGQHFWDIIPNEETDGTRGRWQKVELHCKVASAPGSADGILQVYRDGNKIIDLSQLDSYPTLGENYFREGYLLGWSASGFESTTYEYISNVTFSTQRLQ